MTIVGDIGQLTRAAHRAGAQAMHLLPHPVHDHAVQTLGPEVALSGNPLTIVVAQGLLGRESGVADYLSETRSYYAAFGHNIYKSGIALNLKLSDGVAAILRTAERATHETGQPVVAWGHSEGGMEFLEAAKRRPDLFAAIFALGSPTKPPFLKNNYVTRMLYTEKLTSIIVDSGLTRIPGFEEDVDILRRLREPSPVPLWVVHAPKDMVVPEKSVIRDTEGRPQEHNILYKRGGHMQMAYDPEILRHVHALALEEVRRDAPAISATELRSVATAPRRLRVALA